MSRSGRLRDERHVYLDVGVLRDQLVRDVVLALAAWRAFRPYWSSRLDLPSASVMDEHFPDAAVETPYDGGLQDVLDAAEHGGCDLLVTDEAAVLVPLDERIPVENLSGFLLRMLDEYPERVISCLRDMQARRPGGARTMPRLLITLATHGPALRTFAVELNKVLPPEDSVSHQALLNAGTSAPRQRERDRGLER